MRAEDRKPAKRVFPLLQNLDLDTVTFDQVQSVGDPISIQDMNEQEMLDLIIVNLARLCVKSEWTGLLEAGGGGTSYSTGVNASFDRYNITKVPPFGNNGAETATMASAEATYPIFYPFVAPFTGNVAEIGISVATGGATNLIVGIYSATNALPGTLLGSATIDISSTGAIYQTSFSDTISIEAGTIYWVGTVKSGSVTVTLMTNRKFYLPSVQMTATPNEDLDQVALTLAASSQHDLPATVTADDLSNADSSTTSNNRVNVTVK